jgi:glycerophosphoryl diester phosphodiesterase
VSRPLVIAHRGASGERPENTLAAFERAIELSADMIETDLHLTRDGVVVIHHDASLKRLGARGEIRDWNASDLRSLDAAPEAPERMSIPTLLDVLEDFAPRIEFNLELKVGLAAPYPGLEEQVVREVEVRGLRDRVLFSCFDDGVLERLRGCSDALRLGVLASPRAPRDILRRAERVHAEAIHPHRRLVQPDLVARAHANGLAVYPYTANEIGEMARLLDCGVDGIITNYPSRLKELIAQRSERKSG